MGRRAAWIAWTWCAITLVAGTGAVVLCVLDNADPLAKSHLVFVASCAVAGALVVASRPGNALGWTLLAWAALRWPNGATIAVGVPALSRSIRVTRPSRSATDASKPAGSYVNV